MSEPCYRQAFPESLSRKCRQGWIETPLNIKRRTCYRVCENLFRPVNLKPPVTQIDSQSLCKTLVKGWHRAQSMSDTLQLGKTSNGAELILNIQPRVSHRFHCALNFGGLLSVSFQGLIGGACLLKQFRSLCDRRQAISALDASEQFAGLIAYPR